MRLIVLLGSSSGSSTQLSYLSADRYPTTTESMQNPIGISQKAEVSFLALEEPRATGGEGASGEVLARGEFSLVLSLSS